MIKICPDCKSTWAGGRLCEDCGGSLIDPFSDDAQAFPEGVWKYIRLQYGARRGMIVRVLAILSGPVVAGLGLRRAVLLPPPWAWLGAFAAIAGGVASWWSIHWLAGKAVRVWVLRKDQVSKRRLARALLRRALR